LADTLSFPTVNSAAAVPWHRIWATEQAADVGWLGLSGNAVCDCGRPSASQCEKRRIAS
jgi:hypothetical protein